MEKEIFLIFFNISKGLPHMVFKQFFDKIILTK